MHIATRQFNHYDDISSLEFIRGGTGSNFCISKQSTRIPPVKSSSLFHMRALT